MAAPCRTTPSRSASSCPIWRSTRVNRSTSRTISRRARGGNGAPYAVLTLENFVWKSLERGCRSKTPCSFRRPLIEFVSDVRSFTKRRRSRISRLRSSSSTLGIRTWVRTAASPRSCANSARTIFLASIRSVLRCFAFRFTRRLAGSSTTVSIDIAQVQPTRQPEPLVARLVTTQNGQLTAESPLRLRPLTLDEVFETVHIGSAKRVQADTLACRALDSNHPTLRADLDCHIQSATLRAGPPQRLHSSKAWRVS